MPPSYWPSCYEGRNEVTYHFNQYDQRWTTFDQKSAFDHRFRWAKNVPFIKTQIFRHVLIFQNPDSSFSLCDLWYVCNIIFLWKLHCKNDWFFYEINHIDMCSSLKDEVLSIIYWQPHNLKIICSRGNDIFILNVTKIRH